MRRRGGGGEGRRVARGVGEAGAEEERGWTHCLRKSDAVLNEWRERSKPVSRRRRARGERRRRRRPAPTRLSRPTRAVDKGCTGTAYPSSLHGSGPGTLPQCAPLLLSPPPPPPSSSRPPLTGSPSPLSCTPAVDRLTQTQNSIDGVRSPLPSSPLTALHPRADLLPTSHTARPHHVLVPQLPLAQGQLPPDQPKLPRHPVHPGRRPRRRVRGSVRLSRLVPSYSPRSLAQAID